MKKVLLSAAVIAFFASCKKDYTCTCTDTIGGVTSTSSQNYSSVSGANANLLKASCEATYTSNGVTSTACVWDKK